MRGLEKARRKEMDTDESGEKLYREVIDVARIPTQAAVNERQVGDVEMERASKHSQLVLILRSYRWRRERQEL